MQASATPGGPSLLVIEAGLTLITIAIAFCWTRAGSGFFSKLESLFGALARRRALSVFLVGFTACTVRLLIFPLSPIPRPFALAEFSFLLSGETFAAGRLTNPTHPMWVHFESFHITQVPTYMSMYFPAQGMVLAAGKILAGHPWYGVWASAGLMCAAICWMLYGWLPPGWALLGGTLAILRLALFSSWIDTYMGGAVAAAAGALVLGALPRIQRRFRTRDFFWMALGMAILANSRPYEGLLVCIPVFLALCWVVAKKPHPPLAVLVRRLAPAAALLLATVIFTGYYNYRVFGNVFTPPYAVNRATYASAPHFLWQSAKPEPVYRHSILRDFYTGEELRMFLAAKTLPGFFKASAIKLGSAMLFLFGFAMLAPLVMLPKVVRDRRTRFLVIAGAVGAVGLGVETWFLPHYIAPFTALVYAILLQCMRHLRAWRPSGNPSGLFLVRATPVLCLALAGLRLYAEPLKIQFQGSPALAWYGGTKPLGATRAHVFERLQSCPGQQLAIIRYSPAHSVFDDWVYNEPNIDKSKIVWAREMDPADNLELLRYFKDRRVWLVEPDSNPPGLSPYPLKACKQSQEPIVRASY